MQLLAAFGLPVARTEMLRFGSQKVLSVERFDRQLHSSADWIMRLPQKDFSQAKGLPSHLKYEADGGPGVADLAAVLRGSVQADKDIRTLLSAQLLFWLLGAPDGQAKNFSILVLPQGRYALTPLYDVMSIWPVEGNGPNPFPLFKFKLAMSVLGTNKHCLCQDIQGRHFNPMAAQCLLRESAEDVIEQLLVSVPAVIDAVTGKLPPAFPEWIAQPVFRGSAALRLCWIHAKELSVRRHRLRASCGVIGARAAPNQDLTAFVALLGLVLYTDARTSYAGLPKSGRRSHAEKAHCCAALRHCSSSSCEQRDALLALWRSFRTCLSRDAHGVPPVPQRSAFAIAAGVGPAWLVLRTGAAIARCTAENPRNVRRRSFPACARQKVGAKSAVLRPFAGFHFLGSQAADRFKIVDWRKLAVLFSHRIQCAIRCVALRA